MLAKKYARRRSKIQNFKNVEIFAEKSFNTLVPKKFLKVSLHDELLTDASIDSECSSSESISDSSFKDSPSEFPGEVPSETALIKYYSEYFQKQIQLNGRINQLVEQINTKLGNRKKRKDKKPTSKADNLNMWKEQIRQQINGKATEVSALKNEKTNILKLEDYVGLKRENTFANRSAQNKNFWKRITPLQVNAMELKKKKQSKGKKEKKTKAKKPTKANDKKAKAKGKKTEAKGKKTDAEGTKTKTEGTERKSQNDQMEQTDNVYSELELNSILYSNKTTPKQMRYSSGTRESERKSSIKYAHKLCGKSAESILELQNKLTFDSKMVQTSGILPAGCECDKETIALLKEFEKAKPELVDTAQQYSPWYQNLASQKIDDCNNCCRKEAEIKHAVKESKPFCCCCLQKRPTEKVCFPESVCHQLNVELPPNPPSASDVTDDAVDSSSEDLSNMVLEEVQSNAKMETCRQLLEPQSALPESSSELIKNEEFVDIDEQQLQNLLGNDSRPLKNNSKVCNCGLYARNQQFKETGSNFELSHFEMKCFQLSPSFADHYPILHPNKMTQLSETDLLRPIELNLNSKVNDATPESRAIPSPESPVSVAVLLNPIPSKMPISPPTEIKIRETLPKIIENIIEEENVDMDKECIEYLLKTNEDNLDNNEKSGPRVAMRGRYLTRVHPFKTKHPSLGLKISDNLYSNPDSEGNRRSVIGGNEDDSYSKRSSRISFRKQQIKRLTVASTRSYKHFD